MKWSRPCRRVHPAGVSGAGGDRMKAAPAALVLLVPCLLAGVTTAQTKGEASVKQSLAYLQSLGA